MFKSNSKFSLVPQLDKLIEKNYYLHKSAQEAYKSYVRAYDSHSLKQIYSVNTLNLPMVALSFGFKVPPYVDLSILSVILQSVTFNTVRCLFDVLFVMICIPHFTEWSRNVWLKNNIFLNSTLSPDVHSGKGAKLQKRGGGGGFGYQKSNVHKSKIFKHVNKGKSDRRQFSRWTKSPRGPIPPVFKELPFFTTWTSCFEQGAM